MWVQILVSVVVSVVAYLITPKPKTQAPTAGQLDIPSPKLGDPVPVVFGKVWITDPAISYYGNSSTQAIKSKGGK